MSTPVQQAFSHLGARRRLCHQEEWNPAFRGKAISVLRCPAGRRTSLRSQWLIRGTPLSGRL